ncbi:FtsW/RodA/SpoVE family cell cycle protein [Fictibacillus iocasae]|uniref:FtsW/RodA/SpoVE family cell cycle protein n=1 Tax=Fictibacillus iocasae TaxID=2715437 RepID=A0ABW2NR59_9BACL
MPINKQFQAYMNQVCMLIKNKDVHEEIKLELYDHLETLKEDAMKSGLSEEEAIEKTIARMGDADVVGRKLNETHKAKLDLKLLVPVLSISLFGLFLMYFIQSNSAVDHIANAKIFEKSVIYYLLATALMIGLFFMDYRKILKYTKHIYMGTVLVLLLTLLFGVRVDGIPYLMLGFASINFTAIVPFLLVVAFAGIFQSWNWEDNSKLGKGLVMMSLPVFMVATTSLSNTVLCIVVCLAIMVASNAKLKQLIVFTITVTLLPFLSILMGSNGLSLSEWKNIELQKTLTSTGFFGNGFTQDLGTLSEVHTDFVFAYLVISVGWISAATTIILIALFIGRMLTTAKAAKYSYGKLLMIGFTAAFSFQFILSILTNLGLSPLMGVTMPFMSFGGSHILIDMMSVGLILSVYRRRNLGAISSTKTLA